MVGTSWRGVAVMRSKAHSRKNANTPKQQEQKAKFKVAADFTKTLHDLLIVGFRDQAVQMSLQYCVQLLPKCMKKAISAVHSPPLLNWF